MVVRAGAGAVALSAGILLGAFAIPAAAHASPDTESTASAADDARPARGGARVGAAHQSAPVARRGSARSGPVADDDVPAGTDRSGLVAPAAVVKPDPVPPVVEAEPVVVEQVQEVVTSAPEVTDAVAPVVVSMPVA